MNKYLQKIVLFPNQMKQSEDCFSIHLLCYLFNLITWFFKGHVSKEKWPQSNWPQISEHDSCYSTYEKHM